MSEVVTDETQGVVTDEPQEEVGERADPPDAENTPAKAKQSTSYVVLSKDAGKWSEVGIYHAASQIAAVTAHIRETDAKAGTFVAIPSRSWHPTTLAVETQTKIKLT